MLTALISTVTAALFGSADFLGGLASRKAPALVVSAVVFATGVVIFPVVLLVVRPTALTGADIGFGFVSGVMGMIVGEAAKEGDLVVNVAKAKQLTNMRTTSSDKSITLAPPLLFTLEEALEYIEDDELVEITPQSIRLRKRLLFANDRKKAGRS